MIDQLRVFSVFANLAVAIVAVICAFRLSRRYSEPYLKAIFFYTIFFNLCFLTLLVAKESSINAIRGLFAGREAFGREIGRLGVTLIEAGLVVSMAAVFLGFRDRRLPRAAFAGIGLGVLALILIYVPLLAAPPPVASPGWLERLRAICYNNLMLVEIPFLAGLLVDPEGLRSAGRRRVARAFGSLYIARYPIAIALLYAFAVARPPQMARFIIGHAALLFFNLMPLIWFKMYLEPYARNAGVKPS